MPQFGDVLGNMYVFRPDRLLFAIFCIVACLVVFTAYFASPTNADWLASESGPVETATFVLYLVCAALFLTQRYRLPRHQWIPALLCLLFAARELDLHERVSHDGFLFFPVSFKANHPALHMAFELCVMALVLALFLRLLFVYRWPIGELLSFRNRDRLMMVIGWLLVPVAVLSDGFATFLENMTGGEIAPIVDRLATQIEEWSELLIPTSFFLAILQYRHWRRFGVENPSPAIHARKQDRNSDA